MKRGATRLVLVLMICLILAHPYIEAIDFWDNFLRTGHESEFEFLGFLCMLGLALVFMTRLCALICNFLANLGILPRTTAKPVLLRNNHVGVALAIPPGPIPLRI